MLPSVTSKSKFFLTSNERRKYRALGHWEEGNLRSIWIFSALLLKTTLLLTAFLLFLAGISLFFQTYFSRENAEKDGSNGHLDFGNEKLLAQFMAFQKEFSKVYGSDEERLFRFEVFARNVRELGERIRSDNRKETEWGVTQFFDWTDEELARLVPKNDDEGHPFNKQFPLNNVRRFRPTAGDYVRPKRWDWREKGVVTHVKNQLKCGSCWAFATAATVESQNVLHNGSMATLSEQQLIDCDLTNNGCEGGHRAKAFRYVRDNGLLRDNEYPYRGNDGRCLLPPGPVDPAKRVFVDEVKKLPTDEGQVADWIVERGPVSFGVIVTKGMFQYKSGVFSPSPEECAQKPVGSHAMEVVGFDETADGLPFWILKNSWGTSFGVNGGYLHMARGVDACGLSREVYAALITRH